jgi:hypothetical protein
MTQEQIAALLVARRWAERLPLREHRCWRSIQLVSLNQCDCARPGECRKGRGYIYFTAAGEILSGHTRREAKRVGPHDER